VASRKKPGGGLMWSRLGKFSRYYPCRVAYMHEMPGESEPSKEASPMYFFGEHLFAWVKNENIVMFDKMPEEIELYKSSESFQAAFREANEWLENREKTKEEERKDDANNNKNHNNSNNNTNDIHNHNSLTLTENGNNNHHEDGNNTEDRYNEAPTSTPDMTTTTSKRKRGRPKGSTKGSKKREKKVKEFEEDDEDYCE